MSRLKMNVHRIRVVCKGEPVRVTSTLPEGFIRAVEIKIGPPFEDYSVELGTYGTVLAGIAKEGYARVDFTNENSVTGFDMMPRSSEVPFVEVKANSWNQQPVDVTLVLHLFVIEEET